MSILAICLGEININWTNLLKDIFYPEIWQEALETVKNCKFLHSAADPDTAFHFDTAPDPTV
jgi:hypothetical protein